MIIACICGGVIEIGIALVFAILGAFGIALGKRNKKQHGVHGDQECDCECHQKGNKHE